MGCYTLVAFDGNQAIFTFESATFGWQVALSRKSMTFLFSFFIFALNVFNHSYTLAAVSRDSVVGIATSYGVDDRGVGV
jgi:hypothetical protein